MIATAQLIDAMARQQARDLYLKEITAARASLKMRQATAPLVQGGQGSTDEDVRDIFTAGWLVLAVVAVIVGVPALAWVMTR